MIDWQQVRDAICEGRRFTRTDAGYRVLSDTMMPSGGLIFIHLQARGDLLSAHDGGAAFDELARHGGEMSSQSGLRSMLSQTGFRLLKDGTIWRDEIVPAQVFDAIGLVADASARAAHYLLDRARFPRPLPLDRRLKDALRVRYPEGRANFAVMGKNRQHTFDFGVPVGDQMILLQAVTPDPSSVAAAIVKGIDARDAPGAQVVPLFVYDPADRWQSGTLGMLDFGGTGISIDSLREQGLPLAA